MKITKSRVVKSSFVALLCVVSFIIGIVSSNLIGGQSTTNDPQLEAFIKYYNILKNDWYFNDGSVSEELLEKAIRDILNQNGDPYTYYSAPPKPSTEPAKLGIGVTVYINHDEVNENNQAIVNSKGLFVARVNQGSPADLGGIKVEDLIIGIVMGNDFIAFEGLTFDAVGALIRDERYTKSTFRIKRGETLLDLIVTRDYYSAKSVEYFATNPATCSTCYTLKVYGFEDDTSNQFKNELAKISNPKKTDLIIDLRDNPGGYVTAFANMADLLLPKNKILAKYEDKNGKQTVAAKTQSNSYYNFNSITIVIDKNSASASEAFTLALDYYADKLKYKFQIVGEKSYGKGIAQTTIYLGDGSAIQYTFAKVYDPSGKKCIHGIGILPDVSIPLPTFNNRDGQSVYNALQEQLNNAAAQARALGGQN